MRIGMRVTLLAVGILAALLCRDAVASGDAAALHAKGEQLLAEAEFDRALEAFAGAVRGERDNAEYRKSYLLCKRVIQLRGRLNSQTDPEAWLTTAKPLQAYYRTHHIHSEALVLNQAIHDRFPGAESAAALAESYLEIDKPAKAVAVVEGLPAEAATPQTQVLLALALARQQRLEESRSIAEGLGTDVKDDPDYLRHLACVRALLNDGDGATEALTRSFEQTPPAILAAAKVEVRDCRDFAGLTDTPAFAKAMETASKVEASGCSGGAGCGKCPKRKAAKDGEKTPCGKPVAEAPCGHDKG